MCCCRTALLINVIYFGKAKVRKDVSNQLQGLIKKTLVNVIKLGAKFFTKIDSKHFHNYLFGIHSASLRL